MPSLTTNSGIPTTAGIDNNITTAITKEYTPKPSAPKDLASTKEIKNVKTAKLALRRRLPKPTFNNYFLNSH